MSLKARIQEDVKTAMRAKDRETLGTLRSIMAEIKQFEVDEKKDPSEDEVITILNRMLKQRRESIDQFKKANRQDLVDVEAKEIDVILPYLPEQLTEEEILIIVKAAIEKTGATEMRDMGKIMGIIRPQLHGKADMAEVSEVIKGLLG